MKLRVLESRLSFLSDQSDLAKKINGFFICDQIFGNAAGA
jgi:hypothetical protein